MIEAGMDMIPLDCKAKRRCDRDEIHCCTHPVDIAGDPYLSAEADQSKASGKTVLIRRS
jgi:hypothetical protein